MDRASSLIFPGSKTLAGWWRQLAPYQPQALWIAYAFLHRVDAPVGVLCDRPVEPLTLHILQAMALERLGDNHVAGVSIADLEARLRMPAAILRRFLHDIARAGFVTHNAADAWQATVAGQRALQLKQYPALVRERRVFAFLERTDPLSQRLGPCAFVPLAECAHVAWQVDAAHRFDPKWLADTIQQTTDWKTAFAFPPEPQSLAIEPASEDGSHVILDRPERALLALVHSEAAKELLGFGVKVDGWTLYDRTPVLRLPKSAEVWPEVAHEPPASVWQEAWRSWCRQRQLPANEVESCNLSFHAPRLEVQAPSRLVQRLQAAKSDLFKGEAWLLVGDGYTRTAAQLTMRM